MNSLHILAAIVLLSLTAFNTQRHQADVRQHQMRADIEMRATVLGTRLLDQLATLDFDANAHLGDLALLTPPSDFGGAISFSSAIYLDDVDGLSFVTTEAGSGGPLTFDVETAVRYVVPEVSGFVPSMIPSPHKEVSLTITSDLGAIFSLQRVYSLNG